MLTIGLKATVSFFVKPRNYKVKDGSQKLVSAAEWIRIRIRIRIRAVAVSFSLSLEGEKLLQTFMSLAE